MLTLFSDYHESAGSKNCEMAALFECMRQISNLIFRNEKISQD